jgi:DNA-binding transcriptional MerR regulator
MSFWTTIHSVAPLARRSPGIVSTFSISALERESGVARSTIYFYIRREVLPAPARTASGRYLFTDDHTRLLKRAEELKRSGLSLDQIKTSLESEIRDLETTFMDLAEQKSDGVRETILRVATQEFLVKGYHRTSVRIIVRKAGVTPNVFYSHFPSKSRLLAECFGTFIRWSMATTGPKALATEDLGERLLLRVSADPKARAFESDVLALVRSAAGEDAEEQSRLVQQAWAGIVRNIMADLGSVRPSDAPRPEASLELLAYSLIGALHNASLRASWGEEYDRADVMRSHLWLWQAVLAALRPESGVDAEVTRYEGLIQQLANVEPSIPEPTE